MDPSSRSDGVAALQLKLPDDVRVRLAELELELSEGTFYIIMFIVISFYLKIVSIITMAYFKVCVFSLP